LIRDIVGIAAGWWISVLLVATVFYAIAGSP
jgi:hypothetical protein